MKPQIDEFSAWFNLLPEQSEIDFIDILDSVVRGSGHVVLNMVHHNFEPSGVTYLWLLAESHLAVHTWGDERQVYVQLSSCAPAKFDLFIRGLIDKAGSQLIVQNRQHVEP